MVLAYAFCSIVLAVMFISFCIVVAEEKASIEARLSEQKEERHD